MARIVTCEYILKKVTRSWGSLCPRPNSQQIGSSKEAARRAIKQCIAYEKFGGFFFCLFPLSLEVAASGSPMAPEVLWRLMARMMAETFLR